MLSPLSPTSRAATILGDGGPSALEVAYKRKGIETEIGKNIAAAAAAKEKNRIADDKNKLEQQKQLDLLPATVNLEHASEFANIYNEQADKIAGILARNGGIVPISGPDGAEYRRSVQTIKQTQSNSEQLNKEMLRQLAVIDSQDPNNRKFLPGAREAVLATYGDPKWLRAGTLPPSVIEDHFDVNGYLEPLFSKIKEDQTAWGHTTSEGGTESGTTKFILRDDIKQVAEMGAADPIAFSAFKRQLSNLSPETQGKIVQIAKDNKITPEAAMALQLGIGLVEHVEKTKHVTAPSEAGMGRAERKAGMNWLAEWHTGNVKGMLNQDKSGPNLYGKEKDTKAPLVGSEKTDTFDGAVWGKKVVKIGMGNTEKTVEMPVTIKSMTVDRDNKSYVVELSDFDPATGAEDISYKKIPFDRFENEVASRLVENNPDKFDNMGQYVGALKSGGYTEDIKGGGTLDMAKTQGGGKEETAAERYARIKAGK